MMPSASPRFLLSFSSLLLPLSKLKAVPSASSETTFRTPRVTPSQLALAPVTQALITKSAPNALIAAHASPPKPLSPSNRDSAAEEPTRVVSAAISTTYPLPKARENVEPDELSAFALKRYSIDIKKLLKAIPRAMSSLRQVGR